MPAYKRPLYFSGRLEAFQTPTLSADGVLGEKAFAVWSSSQYNGTYAAYKSFAAKSGSACAISAKTVPTESARGFIQSIFLKGRRYPGSRIQIEMSM